MAILSATNSAPNAVLSIVVYFLEYLTTGSILRNMKNPVMDLIMTASAT